MMVQGHPGSKTAYAIVSTSGSRFTTCEPQGALFNKIWLPTNCLNSCLLFGAQGAFKKIHLNQWVMPILGTLSARLYA